MSQATSGAVASHPAAEAAGPATVSQMSPSLVAYLASTNLITGMGLILSVQLVAITAYFLFKSRYRVKIIFVNLCLSSLLLIISMTIFVIFISKGFSEPNHWHRNRVSTAVGYFLGFRESFPFIDTFFSLELIRRLRPACCSVNVALRLDQCVPASSNLRQREETKTVRSCCLALYRSSCHSQGPPLRLAWVSLFCCDDHTGRLYLSTTLSHHAHTCPAQCRSEGNTPL